jgi:hypothetical protein
MRALACVLFASICGCATPGGDAFVFLGIPENQTSDEGPVGLIGGAACQIKTVTAVSEAPYADYEEAKREGEIVAEAHHAGCVYYAVKQCRCVQFDNASAMVEVLERRKAREP